MSDPSKSRPGALEFRSQSFEPPNSGNATFLGSIASASMSSLSLADLPSPRAGEVPPALSPLDALALQGRLLAKRFEQQDQKTDAAAGETEPREDVGGDRRQQHAQDRVRDRHDERVAVPGRERRLGPHGRSVHAARG